MPFDPILAASDLPALSAHAMERAALLARLFSAPTALKLFHAIDTINFC